jgi:signal transduction histidine kinase
MEAQEALARAAEAARRAAERASQEKSKLIAIVSHELRTPLAAMGGYAELLALGIRGPLNDAQRGDLQRIQEAQSYILRLVDDLVGFSKLETGHLRFDIGDVIVRDALEALVSLVRPQAANKGIIVDLIRGESDAVVRADEERLRQIVLNLLANAIKFTPAQGHVRGTWSGTEDTVLISIGDDGIGIPADKLELVFEPYVQLAVPRAARQTGSGLGLAISRDLARAMGGDLTASSSGEHGTVFTLRLPRSTRVPRSAPAGE